MRPYGTNLQASPSKDTEPKVALRWCDFPFDITTAICSTILEEVVEKVHTTSLRYNYRYCFLGLHAIRRDLELDLGGLLALPDMLDQAKYHVRCMRVKHAESSTGRRNQVPRPRHKGLGSTGWERKLFILEQLERYCWGEKLLVDEREEQQAYALDLVDSENRLGAEFWSEKRLSLKKFEDIPEEYLKYHWYHLRRFV